MDLPNRKPVVRPVWTGLRLMFWDTQGEIPFAWCRNCGGEVFRRNADLCFHCVKEEKRCIQE